MNVYHVVVLLQPTKRAKDEEGAMPKIIADKVLVAKDEQQAALLAARLIPTEAGDVDPSRLEVAVLAFQKSRC